MSKLIRIAFTTLLLGIGVGAPTFAQAPGFGVMVDDDADDPFFPERITCMTDRQIRDDIAARGYTNIALNVPNEKRIEIRATRDGVVYLLDFNFCQGRVVNAMQLRPAQ